ncbi:MAG: hypothetical protein KIT13_00220 [Burkholderiales bacterium]|nr:hypothetical protein [Burkholderiales bacterium]
MVAARAATTGTTNIRIVKDAAAAAATTDHQISHGGDTGRRRERAVRDERVDCVAAHRGRRAVGALRPGRRGTQRPHQKRQYEPDASTENAGHLLKAIRLISRMRYFSVIQHGMCRNPSAVRVTCHAHPSQVAKGSSGRDQSASIDQRSPGSQDRVRSTPSRRFI